MIVRFIAALLFLLALPAQANEPNPWNEDARAIPRIINEQYAYLERLPGGKYTLTTKLQAQADAVKDEDSLLDFAEKALLLLADHHAITGSSFGDSWPVVPSFARLWIEYDDGRYYVTSVNQVSDGQHKQINKGSELLTVDGVQVGQAVKGFWADLGVERFDDAQAEFAARIVAAGRRHKPAQLVVRRPGKLQSETIAQTLQNPRDPRPRVTLTVEAGMARIVINDTLYDNGTIAAFDAAMAKIPDAIPLTIDLTNTPSGGNTVVARAIMGWFVSKPMPYQIHRSPAEERRTGIARQWVEQVLPREGKYRTSLPIIRVGRWTGSMGEGLAVGFHALGARVEGDPMAGLLGAIEDIRLPNSGLVFKLPTERLSAVDGTPRERFMPHPAKPDQ